MTNEKVLQSNRYDLKYQDLIDNVQDEIDKKIDFIIDESDLSFDTTYAPYGDTCVVCSREPTDCSLAEAQEQAMEKFFDDSNSYFDELVLEKAELFCAFFKAWFEGKIIIKIKE